MNSPDENSSYYFAALSSLSFFFLFNDPIWFYTWAWASKRKKILMCRCVEASKSARKSGNGADNGLDNVIPNSLLCLCNEWILAQIHHKPNTNTKARFFLIFFERERDSAATTKLYGVYRPYRIACWCYWGWTMVVRASIKCVRERVKNVCGKNR